MSPTEEQEQMGTEEQMEATVSSEKVQPDKPKKKSKCKKIFALRIESELKKYKHILPSKLYQESLTFLRTQGRVNERQVRKFITKQIKAQKLNSFVEFLVRQKINSIIDLLYR